MKYFVTGGAGFIGSHLVDRLMAQGHSIVVYDNLSTGKEDFTRHHYGSPSFRFIKGDCLEFAPLQEAMSGSQFVFHLAANSDIPKGASETRLDLEQGTCVTYNVMEAMRQNRVEKILFSSSFLISS